MPDVDQAAIERVFRAEYGRAVAVLTGTFGDIDLAEESVQDAFAVAIEQSPGRRAAQPGGLDHHDRQEPGHRPAPPRGDPGHQARPGPAPAGPG